MIDFNERIISISNKFAKTEWYQKNQDELIALAKLIPEDTKDTFEKYNDICEEINKRTVDEVYCQAFKDGLDMASA
jgi:hypothetical protein